MKYEDFSRRWKMRAGVVAVLLILFLALIALISKVRGATTTQNAAIGSDSAIGDAKFPSAYAVGSSIKNAATQGAVKKTQSTGTASTSTSYKKPGQGSTTSSNSSSSTDDSKDDDSANSKISGNSSATGSTNSENASGPVIASVLVDGESYNYEGDPVTVEQLLAYYGIEVGENDWVTPSMDSVLEDGLIIAVNRVSYEEVSETEDGYVNTYQVTYVDGEPVDWELLSSSEFDGSSTDSSDSSDDSSANAANDTSEASGADSTSDESESNSAGNEDSDQSQSEAGSASSDDSSAASNDDSSESSDNASSDSTSNSNADSDSDSNSDSGSDTQADEEIQGKDSESSTDATAVSGPSDSGHLTAASGIYYYGNQLETYYNMDMSNIVAGAERNGIPGYYWVRDDGCKMWGDYIIVACNRDVYPYGTSVETSLGTGISLDTGGFAASNPTQVDIATNW